MKKVIVAAVNDDESCNKAIESKSKIIFVLKGDICKIKEVVEKCQKAGKKVFLHIEMIDGFGKDEAAIKYIATMIKPDGIITTKASLAKVAKNAGLAVVFRVFLIDSQSIQTAIANANRCNPDYVEILPGLIPELMDEVGKNINVNIIAGGLISKKEHVINAFKHNIVACSTSAIDLWNLEVEYEI